MRRFALLLFLTVFLSAQSEVEITAEPHHHLVFSNKQVRVFSVEVPAHSETLMHWHRHEYVFVTLGASDISNEVAGQPATELKLRDGETRLIAAPFAHLVRVLSDKPFRNVTIELLQDESLRKSAAQRGAGNREEDRGLEILPHGTKEILFVKDGVRVSDFELQPLGSVPPKQLRGACLIVALTDLELANHVPVKPPSTITLQPGEIKWIAGGPRQTITNAGHSPAKFIALEFP